MVKQPPKMSARVVNAIRNLREAHGSTSKEILGYILSQCNVPEGMVQRQMRAALKRGLDYGILVKNNGHYILNTDTGPQFASNLAPVDRARRSRRRGRSKRRRRRSRGRGRKKSRRGRPSRRGRRRGRMAAAGRIGCSRCRCTKRGREIYTAGMNPVPPDVHGDDTCTCNKESNMDRRTRYSKSRERIRSRSQSSANSDRDGAIDDRRSIHD